MTDVYNGQQPKVDELSSTVTNTCYRPAGFWMRFWAYVTDLIIVFSINGIILTILNNFFNTDQLFISVWAFNGMISSIIFYVYFLVMTKYYGQTLGKMIFGLKVIHSDPLDQQLKWSDLVFREVIGRFIYKSFSILNVLYLVVAFNKDKQGIHDLFGDTRVVHTH